ncbi:MAG: MFS transporter, partial [Candidatus Micrarchaeota archaeon]|nr:MFS transporter [Candidatus Micrarchaeota archaeon]
SDMVKEERRSTAIGAYNTAIGVAYLPASIMVGALWAFAGPLVGFTAAAGIAAFSAVALMVCCRR